mgnify:FL=1
MKSTQSWRWSLPLALFLVIVLAGCRDSPPPSVDAGAEREVAPASGGHPTVIQAQHESIPKNKGLGADLRPHAQTSEQESQPRLSLLIWEDYLAPEALARFEREHGVMLLATEVDNSEQLKQTLSSRPSDFDLIVADEQTLRELDDLKLLRDLTPALLGDTFPETESFLAPAAVRGNRRSVPYLWGLTVLAGRSEVFRSAEPSWNLLWREDLRIALLDEPSDLIWVALLALGHDPATATKEQIDKAADRIERRFPKLVERMRDPISGLDALEIGEVDLVVTYNGDALLRAAQNPALKVVLPKEGAPLWVDSFAVARDAPSPELAQRFIRFMSSPEVSAETSKTLLYASPNPAARARLEPVLLANPVLYPPEAAIEKCRFVRFDPGVEKHVHQAIIRLVTSDRGMAMDSGKAAAPTWRRPVEPSPVD